MLRFKKVCEVAVNQGSNGTMIDHGKWLDFGVDEDRVSLWRMTYSWTDHTLRGWGLGDIPEWEEIIKDWEVCDPRGQVVWVLFGTRYEAERFRLDMEEEWEVAMTIR